jgi:8-oxo-dGTP diphosphatase
MSLQETMIACSVDLVVLAFNGAELCVLLKKRSQEPFPGVLSLPGKMMDNDQNSEAVALSLAEDCLGSSAYMKQVRVFEDVDRHPEGRVMTIAYYALSNYLEPKHDDLRWVPIKDVPELPFDHNAIIESAVRRMRHRFMRKPIAFELLPDLFSMSEIQDIYEHVLATKLDRRNFARKMKSLGILEFSGEKRQEDAKKPAKLYRVNHEVYKELRKQDGHFLI